MTRGQLPGGNFKPITRSVKSQGALVGTAAPATAQLTTLDWTVVLTFSSSAASVTFPYAFANGVSCIIVTGIQASGAPTQFWTDAFTLTGFTLRCANTTGGAVSGTYQVCIHAVGW